MPIRRAAPLLALLALSCTPFGPEGETVSFFVIMANDTDEPGAGPAVDVEMAMFYATRNADLEFAPTTRETDVLAPGETQVLEYQNGRLRGDAQFEAREPGASAVLAAATCTHRDVDTEESRRVSLTGDGGAGTVGYTLSCVGW